MRYAIVYIGNLDLDCGSWLAGVSSDKAAARRLVDRANLSRSHERRFDVFAIPDEDFVDAELTKCVELGEDAERRRAEWDAAQRDAARKKAAQRDAAAKTRRPTKE